MALYNHDLAAVLGRTPKTLRLAKDTRGLTFELDPADTRPAANVRVVQRGDLKGASFGFKTRKDAWQHDGGQLVRELLDIDLAEISLTAFPVYPQTDVSWRSAACRRGRIRDPLDPEFPWPCCSGGCGLETSNGSVTGFRARSGAITS